MATDQTETRGVSDHLALASDIISAYVSNNHVSVTEFAGLIDTIHLKLLAADGMKRQATDVVEEAPRQDQRTAPVETAASSKSEPAQSQAAAPAKSPETTKTSETGAAANGSDAEPELFESRSANSPDAEKPMSPARARAHAIAKAAGTRAPAADKANAKDTAASGAKPVPFNNIDPKKTITDDGIICLEDGRSFKAMKRHLSQKYGMTPADYRKKWGLAADYPMVAPSYQRARAKLARDMGLGQNRASGKKGGAQQANA